MEMFFLSINMILMMIFFYQAIKYIFLFISRYIKTDFGFFKKIQYNYKDKSIGYLKVKVITYVLIVLLFNLTAGTFIGYTSTFLMHGDYPQGVYTIEDLNSHTSNTFIGELDYIIDDRPFNPFLPVSQGGLNRTFYHFQVYENIEGSLISREMNVSTHYKTIIPMPDPPRYVIDFPREYEINTVYLFFCRLHSSEYSHLSSDYRNRAGDNYYVYASIELQGYNINLPLSGQSQELQDLVASYMVTEDN